MEHSDDCGQDGLVPRAARHCCLAAGQVKPPGTTGRRPLKGAKDPGRRRPASAATRTGRRSALLQTSALRSGTDRRKAPGPTGSRAVQSCFGNLWTGGAARPRRLRGDPNGSTPEEGQGPDDCRDMHDGHVLLATCF